MLCRDDVVLPAMIADRGTVDDDSFTEAGAHLHNAFYVRVLWSVTGAEVVSLTIYLGVAALSINMLLGYGRRLPVHWNPHIFSFLPRVSNYTMSTMHP